MKTKIQPQTRHVPFLSRVLQITRVRPGSAMDLILVPLVGILLLLLLTHGFLLLAVNFMAVMSAIWLFGLSDPPAIEPYVMFLIVIGVTGLAVWGGLSFLKAKNTLYVAYISAPAALLLQTMLTKYIPDKTAAFVCMAAGSFVIIAAVNFFANIVRNELILIVATCLVLIGCVLSQPPLARNIQNQASAQTISQWFDAGKEKINFRIYYPSYHPLSAPPSKPALNGYDSAMYSDDYRYTNLFVSYAMGPLVIYESAPLRNQEALLNTPGLCDLYRLWSDTAVGNVSQTDIADSSQAAASCTRIGAADGSVYKSENDTANGPDYYYYKQLNGTNVLINYDSASKIKFPQTASIDDEVLKVFDSMHEIGKDSLIKSGPDYYLDCSSTCPYR